MRPVRYTEELIQEYTKKGYWDNLTFADIYDYNAWKWPEKEAFVDSRERVTWAQLKERYDRLALFLVQLGFNKDDRVILQVPNCIDQVAMRIALEKAGLIDVYAAMNLGESELSQFIKETSPVAAVIVPRLGKVDYYEMWRRLQEEHPCLQAIFAVGDYVPMRTYSIREIIKRPLEKRYSLEILGKTRLGANEVSQIMATTGTTGLPKLVEMTDNCRKTAGKCLTMRWRMEDTDRVFVSGFIWTGPTYAGIAAAPQVGAACIVVEQFDPEEALEVIAREKPTIFTGFPIHVVQMARNPCFEKKKVESFRILTQGGAPFPQGMAEEVEAKFEAPLITYYGSLDSLLIMCVELDAPKEVRYTSVGKAHPWGEIKLLDDKGKEVPQGEVGTVHCRGPHCSGGFYRNEKMTLEAWGALGLEGWFNMEDLGRFDPEGNLMLVGRKKDMILRGGQNIFPAEIEGMLNAHPKVMHVCVVSMPDPLLGEKACAYIVPRQGETVTLEDVTNYLLERKLAKYKLPERIELLDKLPLLGDKVDKRALKEDIDRKLKAEGKV